MRKLINIVGMFLIVGFALYAGSCVVAEFHNYVPSWANEAALRRAPVLMVYFTVVLTLTAGFVILIIVNCAIK